MRPRLKRESHMLHTTIRAFVMLFACVAIMLATESGAFARSAGAGFSSHSPIGGRVAAGGRVGAGFGWGYGRGWCYWHPYACYRY